MDGSLYHWEKGSRVGDMDLYALRIGWLTFVAYVADGRVRMLEAPNGDHKEFKKGITPLESDDHIRKSMNVILSEWKTMNNFP